MLGFAFACVVIICFLIYMSFRISWVLAKCAFFASADIVKLFIWVVKSLASLIQDARSERMAIKNIHRDDPVVAYCRDNNCYAVRLHCGSIFEADSEDDAWARAREALACLNFPDTELIEVIVGQRMVVTETVTEALNIIHAVPSDQSPWMGDTRIYGAVYGPKGFVEENT